MNGHVDRQLGGRSLNHVITGFLGGDEILLACSDKGDVFAYYTRHMAAEILSRVPRETNSGDRSTWLKPFFEANVGMSAWGLAIHRKSRLIAVSSNLWEIIVFAPALSEPPVVPAKRLSHMTEVEQKVRSRKRNMRIIIGFPHEAHNMPNICFLDDEQGFAEKVGGTDINGHAWIADIWKAETPIRRVFRNCSGDFNSEEFEGETSK